MHLAIDGVNTAMRGRQAVMVLLRGEAAAGRSMGVPAHAVQAPRLRQPGAHAHRKQEAVGRVGQEHRKS